MVDPTGYTLITGASSGIGRSAAIRLSLDHRLVIHGRNLDQLEMTRRMCENPEHHIIWAFDFKDIGGLAASLTPYLIDSGRTVAHFIHCAGMVTILPMRSIDHHVAQEIMNVNFFSAVEIINLLLKKKINSGSLRSILFISSIWSQFGARAHSMYCASKAALDGLMRSLAVELAPNVRVNSILPGAIQTAMSEQGLADETIVQKLRQDYPLGLGLPEDIASAIEFILSDNARWITGQQVVIDGGRTVNMSLK